MKNIVRLFCFLNLLLVLIGFSKAYAVGASTPFTSVECESGTLVGSATIKNMQNSPPASGQSSATLEASGSAYVQLNATGQGVTLTNNTGGNITALNVRFCIPDSAGGGGTTSTLNMYVNGVFRQAINLSSAQEWCYESSITANAFNEAPSAGNPHDFWDETHFFITGAAVASGSTITFQKDSANGAAFYYLDVVDMENPPAALSQPANSLSITTYGAVANSPTTDNTTALNNCFAACQSMGKIAWIPAGTFYVKGTGNFSPTGITIQGAGMWYSTIYGNPTSGGSYSFTPSACTMQDFMLDGNGADAPTTTTAINMKGNNWVINRIWIQHESPGIWADGTGGIIENCRIATGWGDGININNGNGGSGNANGDNLTVTNCFIRGSGDDGIAINSEAAPSVNMQNPTVTNNTIVAPRWANNIGIYGGQNITVTNNLCTDSVIENGIFIGTFGSNAASIVSANVSNNVINRGGDAGWSTPNETLAALAIGNTQSGTITTQNITCKGNIINNPRYIGIELQDGSNQIVANNIVNSPGTTGFYIGHWDNGASVGSAVINNNVITNVLAGQSKYVTSSPSYTSTQINNSWQASTSAPVNGEIVHLVCATSGMALDNNASTTAGTTVVQKADTMIDTNQEWKILDVGGGFFDLTGQKSCMNLDNGGSTTAGTSVTQWTVNAGNINQYWKFVDVGGGYYNVVCDKSNMALDNGGSTTSGATMTQYTTSSTNTNQYWRLEVVPKTGSVYHMICAKSSMALDNNASTTSGTTVLQKADTSADSNQEWKVVDLGGGFENLVCQKSGMTLDNNGSTTAGTSVLQKTISAGSTNQSWSFSSDGGGYYNVICQKSNMSLDNGGSTSSGATMTQYTTDSTNANQYWRLEFIR